MRLFPPYSRYARYYDSLGQNKVGAALARETLRWLADTGITLQLVADVATGTGAAADYYADAGLTVVGLDKSAEMLQASMTGDFASRRPVMLVQGDMTALPFAAEFDLVSCFFDAANYLENDEQIGRFFASAASALRTGGVLAFDLNTRRRMETEWSDACFVAADRPDLFGIYRSWFEADRSVSPLVLTFFEKIGDQWFRFDEEHIERVFDSATVLRLLQEAGFALTENLEFDDREGRFTGPVRPETLRAVYLARKIR